MGQEDYPYGISKDDIIFSFKKLDTLLKLEQVQLEVCLIGGTACLLTGIVDRATIDYDLLNLDYSPRFRNYLNLFNPYDLVDFEATTIPRSFKERLHLVFSGEYLACSILSIEDLILSKLCRNLEKDFRDIDLLILKADVQKIAYLIAEVRKDIHTRYPRLQENFKSSIVTFNQRYSIDLKNFEGDA